MSKATKLIASIILALRLLVPGGEAEASTQTKPKNEISLKASVKEEKSSDIYDDNDLKKLKNKLIKDTKRALRDEFINEGEYENLFRTFNILIRRVKKADAPDKEVAVLKAALKELKNFYKKSQDELKKKPKLKSRSRWWRDPNGVYRANMDDRYFIIVGPLDPVHRGETATDLGRSVARKYFGDYNSAKIKFASEKNFKGEYFLLLQLDL
jgi:hypothetical protein